MQKVTPAQWHQLTNDKAFSYKNDKELAAPQENYSQRGLQKAIMSLTRFLLGPAGTFLMWIVLIGIIVFIIYRLVILKGGFLFGRSNKVMKRSDADENNEEDLAGTNWEKLLQQAMSNNDTRLAVRYRYMWLLQLLQQSALIQYRNDKTNYDYYTELKETDYRQPFKQLTRLYEYAWYGNFPLTSSAYNDFLAHFDHLKNQMAK